MWPTLVSDSKRRFWFCYLCLQTILTLVTGLQFDFCTNVKGSLTQPRCLLCPVFRVHKTNPFTTWGLECDSYKCWD
ncbi:hypothetical protein SKAU_G00328480 [Synaphobranchus kaupii]|uniref:Uncharacterized protein n=1 Tax=Synaphobranchus kaupii TaxID=118154 RepID=A0A9Q1EQ14_SYNKA|nr:hypothetical protein SKAU_G00328480 [Synaphobranchus kaupii]